MRKPAARRRVQDSRRSNLILSLTPEELEARRGRVFLRQSCAGDRHRGETRRRAGDHRDAGRCAAVEDGGHARFRRAHRHLRPFSRRPRSHRRASAGGNAGHAGAAVRSSDDHGRAGHGALELLEEVPDLDAWSSASAAADCSPAARRSRNPSARRSAFSAWNRNWRTTRSLSFARASASRSPPPETIADGCARPSPGKLTFPIIRQYVEKILLVSEDEIRAAMRFLLERMKIVVEPSGAVAAAAVAVRQAAAGNPERGRHDFRRQRGSRFSEDALSAAETSDAGGCALVDLSENNSISPPGFALRS